jgi:tetratricopeptide (TPR) repeat protein
MTGPPGPVTTLVPVLALLAAGTVVSGRGAARAADTWIGARVMARTSETPLKVGPKVSATLNVGSVFRVERVSGDWLWVDSGNIRGWVKTADVVPFDQAAAYFSSVIARNPKDDHAYVSRGIVWHAQKDYDRAIADYTAAIAIDPRKPWPYHNRAVAYHAKRDFAPALADAGESVRLDPAGPSHVANRASVRYALKEYAGAIADYTEALRLLKGVEASLDDSGEGGDPGQTRGRLWAAKWTCARAECWIAEHAPDRAVADYMEAVRLDPRDAATINSLAWLLATCGESRFRDGMRAFQLAARACALTGYRDHLCLDTLAAAYAEAGDFAAAVKWQSIALDLAANDARFADNYRARLKLFQGGTAYHEGDGQ